VFNLFKKNECKTCLDHQHRCLQWDKKTDKLYLYCFGDTKINGYIIREEVTTDLVLRGMPMTARLGITGDLFVDTKGAGIFGASHWYKGDRVHQIANQEISIESRRLERNEQVRYKPPGGFFL